MKTKAIIYIMILIFGTNAKFLRFLQTSKNSYDYSSYSATSTNENLTSKTLSSTTTDSSVVYVTKSGISITDSILKKESGDSSKTENSEFYGVNAAVLVQGGGLKMTGGSITTAAKGANGIVATNSGTVTVSGTEITSTASGSARGLHATFGGKIEASNVKISTKGGSCATLATDRGEGTVTCTECSLSTAGAGSPLIYSTGDITVSKTTGTATGAQAVVIEGKNTATIKEASNLKCNGNPNRKDVDQCGVMLYQSMSGDAASGTSTFNCDKSTIEIQSSSSYYSTAPMFFITNTQSKINLEECTFKYGSGVFLNAAGTSEWGNSGSNGGIVTLSLINQDIVGDFVVDANSGLTINMVGSSIKGKINSANTAAKIDITLDSESSITLTGDSYYTSLVNEKKDGSNLVNGTYKWTSSQEKEINTSSGQGNDNKGQNTNGAPNEGPEQNGQPPNENQNGQTPMEMPSNMPNGQPPNGQPPNGNENENGQNGEPMGPPGNMTNGQPPSGSQNGEEQNGQPPNGNGNENGQNGEPMGPPGNMTNGQPPNGQPPNGTQNGEGQNGQPPNGNGNENGQNGEPMGPPGNMTNGQNGQPPNESQDQNGQPSGNEVPNGQPPEGQNNNNNNDDEEISPDEIGKYIKNNSGKLDCFISITMILILGIIY